ncbi:hypothetical protein DMENIID0001_090020 [Sergentomyia squamirostris]
MGNQASSVNIESVVKDIFECPVCYEKFSGEIVQCTAGHAVCGNCVKRLENCPVCHKPIRGTRNFCMEEIVKELERLGISIEDAIEKIVCKNPTPSKSASQFATPVTTRTRNYALEQIVSNIQVLPNTCGSCVLRMMHEIICFLDNPEISHHEESSTVALMAPEQSSPMGSEILSILNTDTMDNAESIAVESDYDVLTEGETFTDDEEEEYF